MYTISFSCIIYTYCKLILKSPSGRINKIIVLYCTLCTVFIVQIVSVTFIFLICKKSLPVVALCGPIRNVSY